MFRIGQGIDVHRLVTERPLILCGVAVPHSKGLLGHSDADVAVHAVMDAVLGALALGDIGQWFPDTDEKWRAADSMKLLAHILSSPQVAVWKLVNLDLTILAEKPRLSPHMPEMRENLARAFACEIDRISIKATTTEKLGFCGREEGIAAQAVILLKRNP
ncbi:MAG: 2-C-methyl-D-erythritol 2,4-cyclodiphosphate synthase [Lentisphaerae bacterium GWF2_52_8]|nr:MAG: 2-C-methyl-D-erythritol 2,4-cyclodiphosphate synthase [Lentisphaerae bacterium GWF2_52_8]